MCVIEVEAELIEDISAHVVVVQINWCVGWTQVVMQCISSTLCVFWRFLVQRTV